MKTRSINLEDKTVEVRGLYWGELDESSKAQVAEAFTSLPAGVSLKEITDMAPDSKLETDVDVAVAKAEKSLAKFGGLHMGTLLRCGVVKVFDHEGVEGFDHNVAEVVKTLSPREADTVAQAVFEMTDLPDTDGNLESE